MARFLPKVPRCMRCAIALPPDLYAGSSPSVSTSVCIDCIRCPPPVNATLVAVDYAYPWSDLITRYKFGNHVGWAPFFADVLWRANGVHAALESLHSHDCILAMPLSVQRLQSRGFNQAWMLAKALAKQAGTTALLDARLLVRIKHTQPQTTLQRQARLANVKNAFQVEPLRAHLLLGRRVVLIDDVMTSGASLFTAAAALRAAGAAHITAIALARTPAP